MKFILITVILISSLMLPSLRAAESYIVMEAHSGRVLLANDPEKKRPVASLTKVATAKVVLDWAKVSRTDLATLIMVPQSALSIGGPNPLALAVGDQISLRDALYSSLLGSDNITAYALAEHVGRALLSQRQRSGDPQQTFVKEMNHLANALGMKRTKFSNPYGLDLPRSRGYSTASDIARLSVHAMRDTGFAFYVKQKSREIDVIRVHGQKLSYKVSNTNTILSELGINGVKTGSTAAAGQCIVVNSHRSPLVKKLVNNGSQVRNRDLIVVILSCDSDRMLRSKQLISQSWPLYDDWAAKGYVVSPEAQELIVVPRL